MEELFYKSNQYLSFFDITKLFSRGWILATRVMIYFFITSFILAMISIFINDESDPVSKLTLYGYAGFMFAGVILLMFVNSNRDKEIKKISSELPNLEGGCPSNETVKAKQKILCHVLGVGNPNELFDVSDRYSKILSIWSDNKLQFQFGLFESYMVISKYWSFIAITFLTLFIKNNYDKFISASKWELVALSLLAMASVLVVTFIFRGIPYLVGIFGLYRGDDKQSLQRVKYFLSEMALVSTISANTKAKN